MASRDIHSTLPASEIAAHVDNLACVGVEELLTPRWILCGCGVVRLGVEAAVQATTGAPQTVHSTITNSNKGLSVVWLLLTCELWRVHLLPRLLPPQHHKHLHQDQEQHQNQHHKQHQDHDQHQHQDCDKYEGCNQIQHRGHNQYQDQSHNQNQGMKLNQNQGMKLNQNQDQTPSQDQTQDRNQERSAIHEDEEVRERNHIQDPESSLPFIMVLQTEAAALGILEGLVYEGETAAELDGLLLDLVDYCVRQLVPLAASAAFNCTQTPLSTSHDGSNEKERISVDIREEVVQEEARVRLVLACRAVSVLHLLASCREQLPLCVTTRLLPSHDVPQLMAQLLETAPWRTQREGREYLFEEGEWREKGENGAPLPRTECQAWAALASLLLDPEALAGYEISSGRRSALLRLRPRLHQAALAQVPALEPLARWLAALALVTPQPARPPPLVTTLTQVSEGVAGRWEGRWSELAGLLQARFLRPTPADLRSLATSLSAAWDLDALEQLLPDPPMCGSCGQPAGRRCSRCRSQWYCRRECQVQDWEHHQRLCYIINPPSPPPPPETTST